MLRFIPAQMKFAMMMWTTTVTNWSMNRTRTVSVAQEAQRFFSCRFRSLLSEYVGGFTRDSGAFFKKGAVGTFLFLGISV